MFGIFIVNNDENYQRGGVDDFKGLVEDLTYESCVEIITAFLANKRSGLGSDMAFIHALDVMTARKYKAELYYNVVDKVAALTRIELKGEDVPFLRPVKGFPAGLPIAEQPKWKYVVHTERSRMIDRASEIVQSRTNAKPLEPCTYYRVSAVVSLRAMTSNASKSNDVDASMYFRRAADAPLKLDTMQDTTLAGDLLLKAYLHRFGEGINEYFKGTLWLSGLAKLRVEQVDPCVLDELIRVSLPWNEDTACSLQNETLLTTALTSSFSFP